MVLKRLAGKVLPLGTALSMRDGHLALLDHSVEATGRNSPGPLGNGWHSDMLGVADQKCAPGGCPPIRHHSATYDCRFVILP
jgi:hypothetical protein